MKDLQREKSELQRYERLWLKALGENKALLEELKKYQTDPASYVEAVKCLCGSVDDFIKYHHNPIIKQKNEEISDLRKKLADLREGIKEIANLDINLDDGDYTPVVNACMKLLAEE